MKFFLAPLVVFSDLGTMVAEKGFLIFVPNYLVCSKMHYSDEVVMWQWLDVMTSLDSEHCLVQTINE
jgi:hypothetical protein